MKLPTDISEITTAYYKILTDLRYDPTKRENKWLESKLTSIRKEGNKRNPKKRPPNRETTDLRFDLRLVSAVSRYERAHLLTVELLAG